MRWWPVFRREAAASLQSPSLCIFAAVFFALVGVMFNVVMTNFTDATHGDVRALEWIGDEPLNVNDFLARNLFGIILFMMILIVPLMTMRLVAEERKLGTHDLIMSYPLREIDVVLGKFFAAWLVLIGMFALSLVYPALIWWASRGALEIAPVGAAYLGLICAGAAFVSIGLLASCLTENQLVAGLLALSILMMGYFLGGLTPDQSNWLTSALRSLDIFEHSDWFLRGVIRLTDVSHFALITTAALYLAQWALAFRRLGVVR